MSRPGDRDDDDDIYGVPAYVVSPLGKPRIDIPSEVNVDPVVYNMIFKNQGRFTGSNRGKKPPTVAMETTGYDSLHDPHLLEYFRRNQTAKELLKTQGLISDDDRVLGTSADLRQGAKVYRIMMERAEAATRIAEKEKARLERLVDPELKPLPKLVQQSIELKKERERLAEERRRTVSKKKQEEAQKEELLKQERARLEAQEQLQLQRLREEETRLQTREAKLRNQLSALKKKHAEAPIEADGDEGNDDESTTQYEDGSVDAWKHEQRVLTRRLKQLAETKWKEQIRAREEEEKRWFELARLERERVAKERRRMQREAEEKAAAERAEAQRKQREEADRKVHFYCHLHDFDTMCRRALKRKQLMLSSVRRNEFAMNLLAKKLSAWHGYLKSSNLPGLQMRR